MASFKAMPRLMLVALVACMVLTTEARLGSRRHLLQSTWASASGSGNSAFASVSTSGNGTSSAFSSGGTTSVSVSDRPTRGNFTFSRAGDDEDKDESSSDRVDARLGIKECQDDMKNCCSNADDKDVCDCVHPTLGFLTLWSPKCDAEKRGDGVWYDKESKESCLCP